MVEQITSNTNIIVHNGTKIPLHEIKYSYKERLAKTCYLDTMQTPNFSRFEELYLKNHLSNLNTVLYYFIIHPLFLQISHLFYMGANF